MSKKVLFKQTKIALFLTVVAAIVVSPLVNAENMESPSTADLSNRTDVKQLNVDNDEPNSTAGLSNRGDVKQLNVDNDEPNSTAGLSNRGDVKQLNVDKN